MRVREVELLWNEMVWGRVVKGLGENIISKVKRGRDGRDGYGDDIGF